MRARLLIDCFSAKKFRRIFFKVWKAAELKNKIYADQDREEAAAMFLLTVMMYACALKPIRPHDFAPLNQSTTNLIGIDTLRLRPSFRFAIFPRHYFDK